MLSKIITAPKRSFAKRLIALGMAITLGFSALFAIELFSNGDRDHEQSRLSAANVVASISSEIERNLELYDLSLQAAVDGMKLPELSQLSPKVRNLVLFDRASTAKDMGSIFVLDKSGTVIIDSRTLTPSALSHADRDYFKVQELNPIAGLYVSRPWQDSDGEYLIAISRRLSNLDGSFSGAVVGTLRLSYIANLFGKIQRNDKDVLTLIREDGSFVMRAPAYNDQFGHQAGDSALIAIAACIASKARRANDVSARYGGEEFAVLLPGMSVTSAFDLAEKIRISLHVLRNDQQGRADSTPTISIGVASMTPREGLYPKDLIKAADAALYEAKSKGRDRIEATLRLVDLKMRSAAA